jgi:hypothetical protein
MQGIHWQQVKRDNAAAGRHALDGDLRPTAGADPRSTTVMP